jgi:hypothetical protein
MLAPQVLALILLFFVIPVLVFGFVGWKTWLKHQREVGAMDAATAHELADVVEAMQGALDEARTTQAALTRRVQNLEAIVTSEAWDEARDARALADDLAPGPPTDTPSDLRATGDGAARLDLDALLGDTTSDAAGDANADDTDADDLAHRAERLARRLRRR